MIIGYLSLLDFGIGRSLTQVISNMLGSGRESEIPPVYWTSIVLMFALGIVGTVSAFVLTPWFVTSVLTIRNIHQLEAIRAFYVLSVSMPFVITTSGMRGMLEACQRIDVVNAGRIPAGVLMYIAPIAVLYVSNSLVSIMLSMLFVRCASFIYFMIACMYVMPSLKGQITISYSTIKTLIWHGGWMTVTNIIGPLMTYCDRYVISAIVSISCVAYYVAPYEMITKLWLISNTVVGVLFPAMAASYCKDINRTRHMFCKGIKYVSIILYPFALIVVAYAHECIGIWLGNEFADNGAVVLQWLVVGVFIHGVAQMPFVMLQGIGRSFVTGIIHIIELPIYVAMLVPMIILYGINGAAFAWTVRVTIDLVTLMYIACRALSVSVRYRLRMVVVMSVALGSIYVAGIINLHIVKFLYITFVVLMYAYIVTYKMLNNDERAYAKCVVRYMCCFKMQNVKNDNSC